MGLPALPPYNHAPTQYVTPTNQSNPFNIEYQNANPSESKSNSTSIVDQKGVQTNINNNYSNLNYIQYRNGVRLPSEISIYGNTSFSGDGYNVTTVGVQWTPQGRAKRLAHKTINLDNTAREASICAGLLKDGIQIDYALKPELSFCEGYAAMLPPPPPVVTPTVSPDVLFYQQKLEEQNLLLQQMQQRIEQLMQPVTDNKIGG